MKEITVWTLFYHPFIMGGSVFQPEGIKVKVDEPFDLGEGYKGYVIKAPNGKTFVAESKSGAFVGPDIKTVRHDIKTGDKEVMKKQVSKAVEKSKSVKLISEKEFWKGLKCLKDN